LRALGRVEAAVEDVADGVESTREAEDGPVAEEPEAPVDAPDGEASVPTA
jgi:hypothetical protein